METYLSVNLFDSHRATFTLATSLVPVLTLQLNDVLRSQDG